MTTENNVEKAALRLRWSAIALRSAADALHHSGREEVVNTREVLAVADDAVALFERLEGYGT